MKITPAVFEAYLKCPTKCWLRATGEAASGNTYAEWVKAQIAAYRETGTARLVAASPQDEVALSPDMENVKAATWRLASSLAVQAEMDSCTLESELHAVERVPSGGRGKAAQFIPIRFVFTNKLGKDEKLLLAFDAVALSKALKREVSLGKIIHGDNYATLKVKTSALTGEVRKRLEKITSLFASATPPDLVLNRYCAECEFQTRCRKIAVEKDDLSLLANMSAKERQKLRSKGIFTVTQLSYTFRPRRRPKKLRDKREKYHHSLKALAIREKKIHIVGSPELKIEGTPVYLDVEGLPDREFYYLIGLRIGNCDSAVQHSLWADTVADEGKIWREFLAILETVEKPVLIHYGSYETTFFREMRKRHGEPPEGTSTTKAMDSPVNLLSVVYAQIYFPAFSNGLKDVAGFFGFEWSEVRPSGLQSIVWRNKWEASPCRDTHDKLIKYNSEDCWALGIVARMLRELGEREKPHTHTEEASPAVVHTELLPRQTLWPRFESPLIEFEEINKTARWDYQRERVYVRSNPALDRLAKKKTAHKLRRADELRIAKASFYRKQSLPGIRGIVLYPENPFCPACGHKGHRQLNGTERVLCDVHLGRSNIRRRVAKYRYYEFWCSTCRSRFGEPEVFWRGSKYGRSLVAYVIYQLIELHIPMTIVEQSANRLLQLGLTTGIIYALKERAANLFQATRKGIMEAIKKGPLLHVDETHVSIKGKPGCVWVFTNLSEVAYYYTDTREGEFVREQLREYRGVLVSDFYTAYDALECPQQRCLLHLMRDLNKDLLDHPFDEILKDIIRRFAVLLRAIVETVDHHGLKRRFLQKHRLPVKRFYQWLEQTAFESEAANRCKARFEKNRHSLFTFLEHDGIPWNNNNAEHAIKAFAALRDVVGGAWTAKSVDEYLVLLSVCQTCKYTGVDFLDFLRSGEMDIHVFAEAKRRRPRKPLEYPPALCAAPLGLDGSYWLDLFTGTTWMEFRAAGARITGFRPRMRNSVARIRKGDILLCYLTGAMRWVGALEVVGHSNDRSAVWTESDFPERLEVKPLVLLEPDRGVPMSKFAEKAPFYRSAATFKKFKGFLRGSPKRFRNRRDGEMILRMLYAVEKTPVSSAAEPEALPAPAAAAE
jgi:predicted RecB family nuclease